MNPFFEIDLTPVNISLLLLFTIILAVTNLFILAEKNKNIGVVEKYSTRLLRQLRTHEIALFAATRLVHEISTLHNVLLNITLVI